MRISGGYLRGRNIIIPKVIGARPTTDFAKEALFNILGNNYTLEDTAVLDLFAGTGAITYEFISRGVKSVTSVEKDNLHIKMINQNLDALNIKNVSLIKGDVFKFITTTKAKYNYIFADPPYDMDNIISVANLVFEHKLLAEDGMLILENSAKVDFSTHSNFIKCRDYGSVRFNFFEEK